MRNTFAALRVLVAMPFAPQPEGGAAARCAVGLLRGLCEQGLHPHVLVADIGGRGIDPPSEVMDRVEVEIVPVTWPSRWRVRSDRLMRPYGMLTRGRFAERLRELASHSDVVHLVDLRTAVAMALVDRPALAQLDFFTRRDRQIGPPWSSAGRDAVEMLRAERRVCRRARWLLASSPEVARDLAGIAPRAHVAVAPLALEPSRYRPLASLGAPVAGLIGSARWPPTRRAVQQLLRNVWPAVRARVPTARLLLAGRGMERSAFADASGCEGVEWLGEVPSAAGFLRGLAVLLYPLSRGSGAKVKVLEALAIGLPVVTTPAGAEGIGGHDGLAVCADHASLVEATAALLADGQARALAGARAHETFLAHHAPAVAAKPVIELYERMLG